jgi:O-antigen/teichoic acid export membrane protein
MDQPTLTPPNDGLRRKTLAGGGLLLGRQLLSITLKLLGVVLITRYLGPEGYGSYVAAYGVYQFLLTISSVGINVGLLRHEGELTKAHYGTANAIMLGVALALLTAIELGLPTLSQFIGIEGFADVARWIFLALPVQLVGMTALAEIERRLEYRPLTLIDLCGQIFYYVLAAPLILCEFGAVALGAAYLLQQGTTFALAHWYLGYAPLLHWDRSIAASLARYATSFSMGNLIWQARGLVNPLVVGSQLGAYAVGIIGMTVGLLEMLTIVKNVGWRLTITVLARFRHDRDRIRRVVTQGMELQVLVVGTILLSFGWLGHWIIPLAFGARWLPTLEVYPFIALAYLTIAPFNMHTATASVLRLNRELIYFYLAHLTLFATGAAVGIWLLGLRGYGVGELTALPAYIIVHRQVARAIGCPDYKVALLWWSAGAVGLFWRELGSWAIAVPFLALVVPASLRRLKHYAGSYGHKRLQRRDDD